MVIATIDKAQLIVTPNDELCVRYRGVEVPYADADSLHLPKYRLHALICAARARMIPGPREYAAAVERRVYRAFHAAQIDF